MHPKNLNNLSYNRTLPCLKEKVVEVSADFGAGFDVDGDRVGFVDNLGRYVGSGSVTVPIFAVHYLKQNNGGKIVYDVPMSPLVEDIVKSSSLL